MLRKISVWLLMATALIPLVFDPMMLSPYLSPKILFLRGIAFFSSLLLTYLLLFSDKNQKEKLLLSIGKIFKDPIFWAIFVNIVLLGISTFFAFDKSVAFFGNIARGEGFITFFTIFLLYINLRLLFREKEWKMFFIISSIASVLIFLIEIIQAFSTSRPHALSGNPIFLGGYLLFAIFSGILLLKYRNGKNNTTISILGYVSIFSGAIGVFLARSRGPLLALVLGAIGVFVFFLLLKDKTKNVKNKMRRISSVTLVILIIFSGLVFLTRSSSFWKNVPGIDRLVQTSSSDSTTESRVLFTKDSIQAFFSDKNVDRMTFGWGWDNFTFFWAQNNDPKIFYYDEASVDRSHNKFVDVLVMSGILGLISYLFIWFFFVKESLKLVSSDSTTAVAFVFLIISYLVNLLFSFDTPTTLYLLFVAMAFLGELNYEKN